ncbi:MAG TPA: sulfite exporter TauE/SafE family protein, partial [Acidimicrobiia bacterium]|nr:sulfite exporter TauE/SafE family protein [Acidimicrobiia bacterium]
MHLDIALAGLVVGFVIGLTGMGGGALMTPVLVVFFHVPASAAISSDVVASFFLKPIGGGVHIRKRTVNWGIVRWLAIGSVPAAFLGSY